LPTTCARPSTVSTSAIRCALTCHKSGITPGSHQASARPWTESTRRYISDSGGRYAPARSRFSSRRGAARPSAGASGLGEAGDAVEGLAQAPGDLLVFPGKGVRNGHLDGHPRAAGLSGHQQRAPVAAEPGAVPGQPAGGGVGHEPAADVVVVAM